MFKTIDLPGRAMLHDENVYPDPFTFNPDRFMNDGKNKTAERDPAHAAFGFGRRFVYLYNSSHHITVDVCNLPACVQGDIWQHLLSGSP